MIAVDTSAIMAIVLGEPDRTAMLDALGSAQGIVVSSATLVEIRVVSFRRGGQSLVDQVDLLIAALGIEVVPPGSQEVQAAHDAFVRYGKGGGHPAQLNFGDLFGYALAKSRNMPLLFKGDDFTATDIATVG
jgi:ribonuclease VapC